ncbi:MAG TPA: ATP-binding cassette domain-containing protein [Gammaproteobacteria bacterium]|nr:ATP-binding cassette domain-containing protein [Gammaproteobacteria bacterium]
MPLVPKSNQNSRRYKGNNVTSLLAMMSSGLLYFPHYFHFFPLLFLISCVKVYDFIQQEEVRQLPQLFTVSSLICLWVFAVMSPLWDLALGGGLSFVLSLLGNELLIKDTYRRVESHVRPIYVEFKQFVEDVRNFHHNPKALLYQIIGLSLFQFQIIMRLFLYYVERYRNFSKLVLNFKIGDLKAYYQLRVEAVFILGLWALIRFLEYTYIVLRSFIQIEWAQDYKEYIIQNLFNKKTHAYVNMHKIYVNGEWKAKQIGGVITRNINQLVHYALMFVDVFIDSVFGVLLCVKLSEISMAACGLALLLSSIESLHLIINYFGRLDQVQTNMKITENSLPNEINDALESSFYVYTNESSLLEKVKGSMIRQLRNLKFLYLKRIVLWFLRSMTELVEVYNLQILILLPWVLQGRLRIADLLVIATITDRIKIRFQSFIEGVTEGYAFLAAHRPVSIILNQCGNDINALSSDFDLISDEDQVLIVDKNGLEVFKRNYSVDNKDELLIRFDNDFSLPTNSYVLFKGKNGSGKSTVLKLLSGALISKDRMGKIYNKPGLFYQGNYKVSKHILAVSQQGNGERLSLPDVERMNERLDVLISKEVSDWSKTDKYKDIYEWATKGLDEGGLGLCDMEKRVESKLSGGEFAKCEMIKILCKLKDLSGEPGSIAILLDEISSPAYSALIHNFRAFLKRLIARDFKNRVAVVEVSHEEAKEGGGVFTHYLTINQENRIVLTQAKNDLGCKIKMGDHKSGRS